MLSEADKNADNSGNDSDNGERYDSYSSNLLVSNIFNFILFYFFKIVDEFGLTLKIKLSATWSLD